MITDLWDDSKNDKESKLLKYNVKKPFQTMPIEKIKEIAERQALPAALMFYNLNGDINVGMAIRSAAIFGFSEVHIIGRRKYDRRTTVGAENYIKIYRYAQIPLTYFQENNLVPILVEQGGTPLEDFDFKPYLPNNMEKNQKVVLIVGSEHFGLPKEMLKLGAPIVSISQHGMLRSLNVCNAASIIMYEYAKQWRKSVMNRL